MWFLPPGWQELLYDAFGGLPQLPSGWQVKVSREHGLPYYANKELRHTQWYHPGLHGDASIPREISGLKRAWRQLQEEREQRAAAQVAQRQAAADAARRAILDRLEDLEGPTALYAKVRNVQAILRGFVQRRIYQRQHRATRILQASVRHFLLSGNIRRINCVPTVQAPRVPG
ncbi:hypothetical protein SPRG_02525 [Saprolegnia parasitica CBS 223.65]|uniref:WW domain-containing protein n=1 Tax=Saprolegnia parasitica (strain CBS 223.65) TaxID=695850 RepID=A0A067D1C2_SAPPC|nr:hypothetical protein SPRG_02525 [Saprolegnia parasitica CBS 223.65]KDO32832.1 hypothetical protein SPRG_02525 [Saprolegnia parasitica CBS 223.65]|eukprot:XP_012196487.1 hypothetical protein SPRG_02525 [Saprolegnia parasitica CBS 223.65]